MSQDSFHILALSGGGYKGLFTAKILSNIEGRTDRLFGSHFDLICGTSIGGIIALALATRDITAKKIEEMLIEAGPLIFRRIEEPESKLSWPKDMAKMYVNKYIFKKFGITFARGLLKAKHDNSALKQALENIFGDRKIKDLKTRVLIPSANWTKGAPQFFKTPHNPRFTMDGDRLLVDIAMATSAAPVYLPNYEFEQQVYVDGGIVGNAPGIFGVHEAEHAIKEAEEREIFLLSIGALSSKITANQSEPLNKGLVQWSSKLFDFMTACQERTADFMMKQKMGNKYHMIDILASADQDKVVKLDKSDEAATKTLLGLANAKFQEEIAGDHLNFHIKHTAPELNFI